MTRPIEFDRERLLSRRFPTEFRRWDAARAISWARDFGAGLAGENLANDQRFLDENQQWALPMIAILLCDGEFWQQNPDTGIDWRKLVHAEESLTLHRPIPIAGDAKLTQTIVDVRDRGVERGASMMQRMSLAALDGTAYADIDVTTILRGNGGFGGPPPGESKTAAIPTSAPDASVEISTPSANATSLCLSAELSVASAFSLLRGQRMIRGVGCFGLVGRAVLAWACDNDPTRVRQIGVRYAGPMMTEETMRVDLWRVGPGQAVFRVHAVERNAPVLSRGFLESVV